ITEEQVSAFAHSLRREERSAGTIEKYCRDIRRFAAWLGRREITAEASAQWKQHLLRSGYRPVSVNGMLIALNRFFSFIGLRDCCAKLLKVQRRLFRSAERELTRKEYIRLVETAYQKG